MAIRRTSSRRPSTRKAAPRRAPRKVARPWSREEMAFMRKYYRRFETAWCARQLGRTVYSVRYKAVDLNLKKASPSVWKGNKGPVNAFKAYGKPSRPTSRKAASRRTTSRSKSWKASTTRRAPRKASARKTRRARR